MRHHMNGVKETKVDLLPNEMIINIHMFRIFMKNRFEAKGIPD